jgi:hypothetical protein
MAFVTRKGKRKAQMMDDELPEPLGGGSAFDQAPIITTTTMSNVFLISVFTFFVRPPIEKGLWCFQ